jgi:hypothetical protein
LVDKANHKTLVDSFKASLEDGIDYFHVRIVKLFMRKDQTFVNGTELKEELKKLDQRYSAFNPSELAKGLTDFARFPPDDTSLLVTRLWDTYCPNGRAIGPPIHVGASFKSHGTEHVQR